MKRSSSLATSLALAVVILGVVCWSLPCSALEAGQDQETFAKNMNAAGYEAHELQGGHVGWSPSSWSYQGNGYDEYAVSPPAAAVKAGQETEYGVSEAQGSRKGQKPPSPWPGTNYGAGDPSVPSQVR